MTDPLNKLPSSRLAYDGAVFRVEFYVAPGGAAPAEIWLEQLPLASQQKFAALFARMGDTGKIWNERKFKHLTETDQIFEFKVEVDRILCFFFIGRRLILTHGFRKAGDKTPNRMLKKTASGVLASRRGSTYQPVRLASSLTAALLDGLFEHPVVVQATIPLRVWWTFFSHFPSFSAACQTGNWPSRILQERL